MRWIAMAAALAAASPGAAAEGVPEVILAGPTTLGVAVTRVPVRPARRLAGMPGARAELVIEGLAFDVPPGAMFEVSLQGRDGRLASVGVIDFYNLTAPRPPGAPAPAAARKVFDVTDALRRLGGDAAAILFEPTAGVAGPGVRAHVDPAARVRFDSVSIRWR